MWRNDDKDPVNGSKTKAGQTNYDDLYADIILWLKNSWIDYVAPQLYWEFGHKAAPYEILLDWWSKHTYGMYVAWSKPSPVDLDTLQNPGPYKYVVQRSEGFPGGVMARIDSFTANAFGSLQDTILTTTD